MLTKIALMPLKNRDENQFSSFKQAVTLKKLGKYPLINGNGHTGLLIDCKDK